MVGDGDDIERGAPLDAGERLLDGANAIAIGRVHMQIGKSGGALASGLLVGKARGG
jgi:hypothetical protein